MARPTIVDDLEVVVRGDLPRDIADYASSRIAELGDHLTEPVFHTRVRLTHEPNPAVEEPVRAQGNVSLKGRMVRAQVAGRTGQEAVDRLLDRLRQGLSRHARDWEAKRGARTDREGVLQEWRHDAPRADRPPFYPRPIEDRQVIRHKSFTPRRVPPDEAALEMDELDYDFHLFTNTGTARDSVVVRDGGSYRIVDEKAAPRLSIDEARENLELAGLPFVFFVDRSTDRGAVLYHRYDGHYGHITPA
jgi:ribosome-associated translation inhibitor RaiA